MDAPELLVAALALALGALVQGSVGFGMNLVAVPVLLNLDAGLVPGPALVAAIVLTGLVARRDRAGIVWPDLGWLFVGRVPATVLGALAVVALSVRSLAIIGSVAVLLGVAASLSRRDLPRTPPVLVGAGVFSGVFGTTTAIGGPPVALVLQHEEGERFRGTMSMFFVWSGVLSLAALAAFGELGWHDVGAGLLLIPGTVLGYAASGAVARRIDRGGLRVAVLVIATLGAVVTIVRALV